MNQELNSIEEEVVDGQEQETIAIPEGMGASLESLARRLKELDGQISGLNHEITNLKSEREMVSDEIVAELAKLGPEVKGLNIGIGVIKLESKPYPKILDLEGFMKWGQENKQGLPPLTVNPSTFGAWFQEQMSNGQPMPPPELVSTFWKTRAKVNKR